MPHFSLRTPEGSRLKIAAIVLALAVCALGTREAKSGEFEDTALDLSRISQIGLTVRVAVDGISGVAISGYDPVAYFVTGRAVFGSTTFEAVWNGAAWRFANEGNRAAFLADPTVYAPRFGGYDADSIAGGVATPGDPKIFAIADGRLFLFRDEDARRNFLAGPDRAAAAERAWPALELRLIR